MSEPHKPVGAIFDAAIELPPERRAAYVLAACAGEDLLRQRVEALLRAHDSAGSFMDSLAVDPRRETPVVKPAEQPGDRIGRYKLLQQIGEGGCGVVYMAEQAEPVRRRVALKVIKLGMDTKEVVARCTVLNFGIEGWDHLYVQPLFLGIIKNVDETVAEIYEETIMPDETFHFSIGQRVLRNHCDRADLQRIAVEYLDKQLIAHRRVNAAFPRYHKQLGFHE